jgi:hypothetical protein
MARIIFPILCCIFSLHANSQEIPRDDSVLMKKNAVKEVWKYYLYPLDLIDSTPGTLSEYSRFDRNGREIYMCNFGSGNDTLNSWSYTYNASGLLIYSLRVCRPHDTLEIHYTYTSKNQVERFESFRNRSVSTSGTYEYDSSGHLVHYYEYEGGNRISRHYEYEYDKKGRKIHFTDREGQDQQVNCKTTYTYDGKGDPIGEESYCGKKRYRSYSPKKICDKDKNVIEETCFDSSGGVTSTTYNTWENGRLTRKYVLYKDGSRGYSYFTSYYPNGLFREGGGKDTLADEEEKEHCFYNPNGTLRKRELLTDDTVRSCTTYAYYSSGQLQKETSFASPKNELQNCTLYFYSDRNELVQKKIITPHVSNTYTWTLPSHSGKFPPMLMDTITVNYTYVHGKLVKENGNGTTIEYIYEGDTLKREYEHIPNAVSIASYYEALPPDLNSVRYYTNYTPPFCLRVIDTLDRSAYKGMKKIRLRIGTYTNSMGSEKPLRVFDRTEIVFPDGRTTTTDTDTSGLLLMQMERSMGKVSMKLIRKSYFYTDSMTIGFFFTGGYLTELRDTVVYDQKGGTVRRSKGINGAVESTLYRYADNKVERERHDHSSGYKTTVLSYYNANGELVRTNNYGCNGELNGAALYTYKNGRLLEVKRYRPRGANVLRCFYSYYTN